MTADSLGTIYDSKEFFEGREKSVNYYSFLSGEEYLRRTARGRVLNRLVVPVRAPDAYEYVCVKR